jgi:hypothetical protein
MPTSKGRSSRAVALRAGLVLLALIVALPALQGCREDEQDRVLFHEPGVYKGKPDPALPEAQVDELRQRARQQGY